MADRPFSFLPLNDRPVKPRRLGLTEVRGPYYSVLGARYLLDLLETMGEYIDSLKFAGGSFTLLPAPALHALIDEAHRHDVLVSTGGFLERVLTFGSRAVDRYIQTCHDVGFDILEVSAGFVTLPDDDWVHLVRQVQRSGLKAKPEVGIQFGAGGASAVTELAAEGTGDVQRAIRLIRRFLEEGVERVMIESEGITEQVAHWRTDIPGRFIEAVGLEHLMFEAADPDVFGWYVKQFGPAVNLFVDHSQIVQLECLRSGAWGTKNLWGRVASYAPPDENLSLIHTPTGRTRSHARTRT